MFTYCNNNPVNYLDMGGTDPGVLRLWTTGMVWLPLVDFVLPIGDIIYVGGILLLGIIVLASDYDDVPEISYDETGIANGSPSPNNNDDDDDDYDDDYWNDENNFAKRERVGKQYSNAPRSNKAQNSQTRSIARKKALSYKKQELLHRYSKHEGYSYQELLAELEALDGIK